MNESVATPIVASPKIARGGAAERMRRSRQRRRKAFAAFGWKYGIVKSRVSFAAACSRRANKPIGTPS